MLVDYIVTLGLDSFKGFIGEKYDAHRMKEAILSYVEKQRNINLNCTLEEEIDFEGVVEYLCNDLHEDIEQRLTGENSEIRGRAHRHIVEMAVAYAQAHTPSQVKRVKKMVSDALNILRSFYNEKLSREQKLLATRIAEDVEQNTAQQLKEHTTTIIQAFEKGSPLSHDQARRLAQEGKLDELADALTDFTDTVSATHELKGYYGFEPKKVNGKQKLVSVALTKEAQILYPPRFECYGRAYIGDREICNVTPKVIEYAHNHQLTIRLKIDDACKYLGAYIDPQQCEAEELVGEELLLPPIPFPEAVAYSIIIDDVTYYEYVLLRIKERFEDGTVFLTNKDQGVPFGINIKMNPPAGKLDCSVVINGGSNLDHLKYCRFLKAVQTKGHLKIHTLGSEDNLLEAQCNGNESAEYMERLDRIISFLENMVAIEEHFGEKIDVPEHIVQEDVELVQDIATLVHGNEVRGNWSRYEASMTVLPQTKENMTSFIEKPSSFSYVGSATVSIFGHNLTYSCARTFLCAKLENPQKVAQLLEILEEGDDIKMVFIPGDESGVGEFADRLFKGTSEFRIEDLIQSSFEKKE